MWRSSGIRLLQNNKCYHHTVHNSKLGATKHGPITKSLLLHYILYISSCKLLTCWNFYCSYLEWCCVITATLYVYILCTPVPFLYIFFISFLSCLYYLYVYCHACSWPCLVTITHSPSLATKNGYYGLSEAIHARQYRCRNGARSDSPQKTNIPTIHTRARICPRKQQLAWSQSIPVLQTSRRSRLNRRETAKLDTSTRVYASMRIVPFSEKTRRRVEIACLFVVIFVTVSLFALPVVFQYVKVSLPDFVICTWVSLLTCMQIVGLSSVIARARL